MNFYAAARCGFEEHYETIDYLRRRFIFHKGNSNKARQSKLMK
jgi:hypothetical protein